MEPDEQNVENVQTPPVVVTVGEMKPSGRSKKTYLVVATILIAVALIGGGLFVVTERNDKPEAPAVAKDDAGGQQRQETPGASIDDRANDAERKADLNAIQANVEAYFAVMGKYPTLADVNDPAFRAQNMKGLDPEALHDPENTDDLVALSATPEEGAYAYKTSPAGCDNVEADCSGYTLLAFLSTGDMFTQTALN